MARVSAAEKAESHTAIVEEASRLFRQRGVAATSIADVMQAAGLTNGGFYRHFESKEELVGAAFRLGVDTALKRLESAQEDDLRVAALNDYIAAYLSSEHVENDRQGCVLAALAAEAARGNETLREAASQGAARVVSAIARALGGGARNGRSTATMIFASLIGTVSLARVETDRNEQNEILKAGRKAAAVIAAESRGLADRHRPISGREK